MTVEPLQVAPGLVSMALYAKRAHTLAGTPRAVPPLRQISFHGGALLILVSLVAFGDLADELFWAHMAEHLLIADLGALALVLGLTGPVLAPVLRISLFDALRALAHPVPAFGLWALNLFAWHVPALHEAAVENPGLHAVQHMAFVAFGVNVWLCLFGPLPKPAWFGTAAKAGYVVAVRLAGAVLANVLLFGGEPFYDVYAAGEAAHGISAAGDQTAAGSIMMIEESILTIFLFGVLFLEWGRHESETRELLDLAGERGVELSPDRAARAVAAGRAKALRERIDPPRT